MSEPPSYYVDTEAGRFWIRPHSADPGKAVLSISGRPLGAYPSAEGAADDVREGHTGFPKWDDLRSAHRPRDLSEWTRVDG